MEKLGAAVGRVASPALRRESGAALPAVRKTFSPENLPPSLVARTEIDLAREVISAWRPSHGGTLRRRELTDAERELVLARHVELAGCLAPFEGPEECDRVAAAIADMYGSFTSMRHGEEDAAARVNALGKLLVRFPAWAIEKACLRIRTQGVERDGKPDPRWPPSDAEAVAMVEAEVGSRRAALSVIEAMLSAPMDPYPVPPVRDPAPVRETPAIGRPKAKRK